MILVVGAGLSGAVLAERLANHGYEVDVIDRRDHIAGNCYDYTDPETGIRINKYGAHLFHTNEQRVWEYIQHFGTWKRWEHQVYSYLDGQYVPMPVNISTVNMVCGEHLSTPDEMDAWLEQHCPTYPSIDNSAQMAKSRMGEQLYQKLVAPYTWKQWNKTPEELDPSVSARIPVRRSFDRRYFSDRYQALPVNGYTGVVAEMINHPKIHLQCQTDFRDIDTSGYTTIFFTGPIDTYFQHCYGALEYRSVEFHTQRYYNIGYYQINSVVNHPDPSTPYTRCVEYKHFLSQESPHSIVVSETTCDGNEPYYPVPNQRNHELYRKYQALAEQQSRDVIFVGRLANYKYFNMDQAISNALDTFDTFISRDCA